MLQCSGGGSTGLCSTQEAKAGAFQVWGQSGHTVNFWTEEILDSGILHHALCVSPNSKMRQLKSLKRWDESSPNSCFQTEIENKLSLFLSIFCTSGGTQPQIHYFPLLWAHNNTAHTAVLLGGAMGLTLATGMEVHHLPLSSCSRIRITHRHLKILTADWVKAETTLYNFNFCKS